MKIILHRYITIYRSDLLSWLGADQHPEGSFAVERLPEENFHFRERSEEHQVSIYGKQLLSYLQAGHLTNITTNRITISMQAIY